MCGRFTIAISVGFYDRFSVSRESSPPLVSHYNITPSMEIPVILRKRGGDHIVTFMTWGLVPFWSQDRHTGRHPINARAETLTERPMFSRLVEKRRCLIPASGFYEWKKTGKDRIPYYIHRKDDGLFAFAGLYDIWRGEGSPFCSCTLITTIPNPVVRPLHDRMPAILQKEDEPVWLSEGALDGETLSRILLPYPAEELESYRISRQVNDTTIDSPHLIARLKEMPPVTGEST
jgi:putative SOS response-associated peptidase YedK